MEMMDDEDAVFNGREMASVLEVPSFLPIHEALPKLTLYERVRLDTLTSINFLEFQGSPQHSVCIHPERHILFKGFRILEKRIERLLAVGDIHDEDRTDAFLVFLKMGHISLLAGDYARSLSAYQQALNLAEEHFWKDSSAYFGIGIVYLHFKAYRCAIESFNRQLYTNPTSIIASETNARLGVCYKASKYFSDALRHFHSALNDRVQPAFLLRPHLKLNIALTHDSAGEIEKAYSECTQLLADENTPGGGYLRAAIERELGWLCYRAVDAEICQTHEERRAKLMEAEQHLQESKTMLPDSGKTHYYLGRCFGEQREHNKAHDAFLNYRASIDKSESDSDTWCSIGVLYHQQNQPMDALQAFVCAVDLDPEHSAAWTNLGQLYESHFRYVDALACYKNAIKFSPACPEPLKARIICIEKEIAQSPALISHQPRAGPFLQPGLRLPALKEAGTQPIPSELRQRQEDTLRAKQQRYRDGSLLWRMGELSSMRSNDPNVIVNRSQGALDPSQLNMLRILKYSESTLDDTCKEVLKNLEHRLKFSGCMDGSELPLCKYTVSQLPSEMEAEAALRHYESIFDIDDLGDPILKPKPEPEDTSDSDGSSGDEGSTASSSGGGGGVSARARRAKEDRAMATATELPNAFSLLAPLKIPIDVTATELLSQCHVRVERPTAFRELFEERVPPPMPPVPPTTMTTTGGGGGLDSLHRPTPLIQIESRKDAHSIELHKFCENSPIVLIRGLTTHLKMDLSLFSTKTLLELCPDHEVEVRSQYKMPPDLNLDHLGRPTWACDSTRSFTTVSKYASYQAESFKHSLKEESDKLRNQSAKYGAAAESAAKRRRMMEEAAMPLKVIKFGTNVDLSDDLKFKAQLTELAKMPPFCRVIAGCNLLSHLGHTVLGMNTVQLYMKVPGTRTPGHTENNCLASVNINIGPGDCEWFGVPYEHWGVIDKKCKEEGTDFLKGSWWPNYDELIQMGVPVYRFTQKAGDLVWVGAGCVHWVQSNGWCNNVAWNVGPMTHHQLTMAVHQYEWNKLQDYKSLVPMQHLFWQIAKNVRVTNQKVYTLVRGMLIRSLAYCKMIADWAEKVKPIKAQPRQKGEITHYCSLCEVEVFNILFVREINQEFVVSCVDCARRGNIQDYIILQQIPFSELTTIFDGFQLHMIAKANLVA